MRNLTICAIIGIALLQSGCIANLGGSLDLSASDPVALRSVVCATARKQYWRSSWDDLAISQVKQNNARRKAAGCM